MKKTIFSILALLVSMTTMAQYQPSEQIKESQKEFQDFKFGIFIHWGIYSMLGDGEWVMNNKSINYQEYPHLADGFYPSRFNADEWVRTFREAGAKYITFTTRHHDGFSMWHTAQDTYNIVDGTPFKRDILKELADACHNGGLSLHLYYSHLDWHRLDYPLGRTGKKLGRPTDKQNWRSYYTFMNNQIRELLTNYGRVDCIWFDGWWDHDEDKTPFNWELDEQYAMIHQLQPQCIVANNHHGKPYPGEDIQIFEQDLPGENTYGLSGQDVSQLPLETCLTMNYTWGYSITDKNYKSKETLVRELVRAAGKNCNLLLNVGPRPDGQLPIEAVERLQYIGQFLGKYGDTIYGTRGGLVAPHDWGVSTQKGNRLFIHILSLQDKALFVPTGDRKVKAAKVFINGKKVEFKAVANGYVLTLPEQPSGDDYVVELTLHKPQVSATVSSLPERLSRYSGGQQKGVNPFPLPAVLLSVFITRSMRRPSYYLAAFGLMRGLPALLSSTPPYSTLLHWLRMACRP